MKESKLTQEIYDDYYNKSYILSLLCNKNVLDKLEADYASDFIREDDLLDFLKLFVNKNQILFLADERMQNNIDLIIENSSLRNNDIKNAIKKSLNATDYEVNCRYSFLKTQYIFRKYGCNNILKLKGKKYVNELNNLPEQFWNDNKELLYDCIGFDFKLISSSDQADGDYDTIYDECLYNYQLFASINYFKIEYPYIFKDETFLSFVKLITRLQDIGAKNIKVENCLFDDFDKTNKKVLKYVSKELKRLW